MWVKGSGADMRGSIETDYPALRLAELTALRDRGEMTDEEMTDLVTRALMDPGARRPSIETLLHAFLPFTHIDHVHADAICALTNHAEGERVTREALGDGFAYVDWIRPGFELSKIVGDLAHYEGVVLAHHGLVTWAEDSRECYQRTIDVVDAARAFVAEHSHQPWAATSARRYAGRELETLLLHLRGASLTPVTECCVSMIDCEKLPTIRNSTRLSPVESRAQTTCCASSRCLLPCPIRALRK